MKNGINMKWNILYIYISNIVYPAHFEVYVDESVTLTHTGAQTGRTICKNKNGLNSCISCFCIYSKEHVSLMFVLYDIA